MCSRQFLTYLLNKMPEVKTEPCSEHCTKSLDCSCLIDLSSPATIERGFYAWLNRHDSIAAFTLRDHVIAPEFWIDS
ncbi:hypothetical protein Y032_0325g2554 [Ancylostoma ceylanicum]|uniref:Uncharacterized protein n=1 Tax=Ancylostoma ceylanicum TaxID=53326 RepID=A0A016S030_9BILA|nr:hypothetical protein Y032_0325g2554 [Ancylostoma ceylanicum]